MIWKANQRKVGFAWGVDISGMRTDSRFSGVSAEFLIKKHSTQSEILCNSGCTSQGLFISWYAVPWYVLKKQDRMCNCNTVARNVLQLPPGQGPPDTRYWRRTTEGEQTATNCAEYGAIYQKPEPDTTWKTGCSGCRRTGGHVRTTARTRGRAPEQHPGSLWDQKWNRDITRLTEALTACPRAFSAADKPARARQGVSGRSPEPVT